MTTIAVIAAVYVALVLVLSFISFGPFQVRVAEALAILPVFGPVAVWGIGLGCFIANLASPYGALDTVVGTLASVIAAILTYRLRSIRFWGLPILSALSPVVVNAIVIGAMLSVAYTGRLDPLTFGAYALSVGAGQMIACVGLGLPLYKAVERTKVLENV